MATDFTVLHPFSCSNRPIKVISSQESTQWLQVLKNAEIVGQYYHNEPLPQKFQLNVIKYIIAHNLLIFREKFEISTDKLKEKKNL